jgi:hypothetical protein
MVDTRRIGMGARYDSYDGTLHLYWPDDLHLIGSRAALVSLRDTINRALAFGQSSYLGLIVETEARSVVVTHIEPKDSCPIVQRREVLTAVTVNPLPKSLVRPQPTRAPMLAGVDREYW